jgi:putative transposase
LCRRHGISQQTFYRWKAKYAGLEISDAKRLRQLEEENRKLKQLVAERALDTVCLKAVLPKKFGPLAERKAVRVFREATKCSERRARWQMEIARAMMRYQTRASRFAASNVCRASSRVRNQSSFRHSYPQSRSPAPRQGPFWGGKPWIFTTDLRHPGCTKPMIGEWIEGTNGILIRRSFLPPGMTLGEPE